MMAGMRATTEEEQTTRYLPPPFATSPPRHRQSPGLAQAERVVTEGGVDESAAPRLGSRRLSVTRHPNHRSG
jgi:hypothetical protein